ISINAPEVQDTLPLNLPPTEDRIGKLPEILLSARTNRVTVAVELLIVGPSRDDDGFLSGIFNQRSQFAPDSNVISENHPRFFGHGHRAVDRALRGLDTLRLPPDLVEPVIHVL